VSGPALSSSQVSKYASGALSSVTLDQLSEPGVYTVLLTTINDHGLNATNNVSLLALPSLLSTQLTYLTDSTGSIELQATCMFCGEPIVTWSMASGPIDGNISITVIDLYIVHIANATMSGNYSVLMTINFIGPSHPFTLSHVFVFNTNSSLIDTHVLSSTLPSSSTASMVTGDSSSSTTEASTASSSSSSTGIVFISESDQNSMHSSHCWQS
jgi:hypothetical protein